MNIQRTFKQTMQKRYGIGGKPEDLLKPLSLEESKKKCEEIKATPSEIKKALTYYKDCKFICSDCGYHSLIIRRCPACGGWMMYFQLYQRIQEQRGF